MITATEGCNTLTQVGLCSFTS